MLDIDGEITEGILVAYLLSGGDKTAAVFKGQEAAAAGKDGGGER